MRPSKSGTSDIQTLLYLTDSDENPQTSEDPQQLLFVATDGARNGLLAAMMASPLM